MGIMCTHRTHRTHSGSSDEAKRERETANVSNEFLHQLVTGDLYKFNSVRIASHGTGCVNTLTQKEPVVS